MQNSRSEHMHPIVVRWFSEQPLEAGLCLEIPREAAEKDRPSPLDSLISTAHGYAPRVPQCEDTDHPATSARCTPLSAAGGEGPRIQGEVTGPSITSGPPHAPPPRGEGVRPSTCPTAGVAPRGRRCPQPNRPTDRPTPTPAAAGLHGVGRGAGGAPLSEVARRDRAEQCHVRVLVAGHRVGLAVHEPLEVLDAQQRARLVGRA